MGLLQEHTYDICTKDSWGDGSGIRKMRKFFENFSHEFADYSMRYHQKLGEFPFIYSERSLTSVVLPALMKAGDDEDTFVFMEQPFKKDNNIQRFLDFYVQHGNNLYLIEMKHGWDAKRTNNAESEVLNRWNKVHEQIEDLTIEAIEQMCTPKAYKNIFKIALLVMPVHTEVKDELDFEPAETYHNKIENYFKADVKANNWLSVWKIDEKKKFIRDHSKGKQFFPYVAFVMYQEKLNLT